MAVVAAALTAGCGGDTPPSSSPTPASAVAETASSPPARRVDLQAHLGGEREWYGAPGALALIRDADGDRHLLSGAADLGGTPLTEETTFRIASITKSIVAALILDAVDRGELSLADTVNEIIPGLLRSDPPVTVGSLLDHTSGVFNAGDEGDVLADLAALTDPRQRQEALDLASRYGAGEQVVASDDLLVAVAELHDRYFEPGAGYHYSNVNYQLAAMVLEQVTGRSLSELLEERIVEPLGLERTWLAPADPRPPDLRGHGISASDGAVVDITDDVVALGNGGSGGIISTADELLTMLQAIVGGRLLPSPVVGEMLEPTVQSEGSYGLGIATYHLSCGTFYGHEGSLAGTRSIAMVSPDATSGVVIALNLRSAEDPRLPALADTFLCEGG